MHDIPAEQIERTLRGLNPHWGSGAIDDDIRALPRRKYFDLYYPLAKDVSVKRGVVLLGPRRVGKTVMLRQTIQRLIDEGAHPRNIVYIPLDTPLFYPFSLEDLLQAHRASVDVSDDRPVYLLFDEIEYLKNWEGELKSLIDTTKGIKFIAAGSAAGALSRKSDESGAGRFTDFLLPPLTFCEYIALLGLDYIALTRKAKNNEFLNYLTYGGFPESLFNEAIRRNRERFLRHDIIDKVLLRDLPSLYGIDDAQELNRLFQYLAFQTGAEVTYDQLSGKSGIAKNTIKRYIEYLEAAFLIRVVNRVDESCKPFERQNFFKVYLTNPSIYSLLTGPVDQDDSASFGPLVETAAFSQFLHTPDLRDRTYYARFKGGKGEVDMVVVGNDGKPIGSTEIKWSDRYPSAPEELHGLVEFCQKNGLSRAAVTTKTMSKDVAQDGVTLMFMPASDWCYFAGNATLERR